MSRASQINRHNSSERRQLQRFIDAQKKKGKQVYLVKFNRGKVLKRVKKASNVYNFEGDVAVAVKNKKQLQKARQAVLKYRRSPLSKMYGRLTAAEKQVYKHPANTLSWI